MEFANIAVTRGQGYASASEINHRLSGESRPINIDLNHTHTPPAVIAKRRRYELRVRKYRRGRD